MRKPSYDKPELTCSLHEGSGALAKVKRFLSMSIGGGRRPSASSFDRSKPCVPLLSSSVMANLKAEASHVIGRPLDQLRQTPQGVPDFVHTLCCHILSHGNISLWSILNAKLSNFFSSLPSSGVDYETLIAVDLRIEEDSSEPATDAAVLLKLFLQQLPQPLLTKEVAFTLLSIRNGKDYVVIYLLTDGENITFPSFHACRSRKVRFDWKQSSIENPNHFGK